MNKELIKKALEIGYRSTGFVMHHRPWNRTLYDCESVNLETIMAALAELDRPEAEPAGMGGYSPCGGCELESCEGCRWERNDSERVPQ